MAENVIHNLVVEHRVEFPKGASGQVWTSDLSALRPAPESPGLGETPQGSNDLQSWSDSTVHEED